MNNENEKQLIAEYRKKIANMSVTELQKELADLQNGISKMILDSDLVLKAAIVTSLIKEKEHE